MEPKATWAFKRCGSLRMLDCIAMEQPPKSNSKSDIAQEVGRAIVSTILVAGGPTQVVFESISSAPIEKLEQAWLEELARSANKA